MRVTTTTKKSRLKVKINKTEGIIHYGPDNLYPQHIFDAIGNSGTATSVTEVYAAFIQGDGFLDQDFKKSRINRKGLTVERGLELTAEDMARYNGFALHIGYDALLNPSSVTIIPFEHVRLTEPDDQGFIGKLAIYKDWGRVLKKKFTKKDIDFLDIYNPDKEVIARQVEAAGGIQEYKGQVLYYSKSGPICYPLAPLDPVLEDVDTDGELKIFKNSNVKNNFMASLFFYKRGRFEDEKEKDEFHEELNDMRGAESGGAVVLVELDEEDQKDEIDVIEIPDNEKLFEFTEQSVQGNIRQARATPPVLIGDLIAGKLGTSEEIEDATRFYNYYTRKERKILSQIFEDIFSRWTRPINTSEDYTILPVSAFSTTDIPSADSTAIMKVLESTGLRRGQKVSLIKLIFALSDEQIEELVPEEALETQIEENAILTALTKVSPLVANKILEELTSEEIRSIVDLIEEESQEEEEENA